MGLTGPQGPIGDENVGTETTSSRIGPRKRVPFEEINEEALCEVLRVVNLVTVRADIPVNGVPVYFAEAA
jgi:hypothetical protein